eukprot:CAMPEP_0206062834 /NCGR_PEP_ID=MMETSP1466-20131121/57925_1 /ASSEMBLY_ACC=CAM_ASM_001126 /TAXON_ID=44452 /ORGANISM="Pavlova gyrans, Strain CCMP608" /LENGTH=72 /DNA_ID=CAMNT_0053438199 /DNA_START=89 /DNA_END=307 /DNA_ORIENTATION=+
MTELWGAMHHTAQRERDASLEAAARHLSWQVCEPARDRAFARDTDSHFTGNAGATQVHRSTHDKDTYMCQWM